MVIYIDIFIIENTILNMIIFLTTKIISKTKIKFIKIILFSFLGSIYSLLEYILWNSNLHLELIYNYRLNNFIKMFMRIIVLFLLINVFLKGEKKYKLKFCFIYLIVSFLYSGITYYLSINFYEYLVIENDVGLFSSKNIFISFIISFVLCFIFSKCIYNGLNQENRICNIELYLNNKNVKIKALIDSGNMIKEPITGKEVIIVESNIIKVFFTKEDMLFFKNITEGKLLDEKINEDKLNCINNNEKQYKYSIKVIPFSSLGNPNGLLCGIKPDKVKIFYNGEIILNDVLIGIYFGNLICNNEYSSIIGLGSLKEELI